MPEAEDVIVDAARHATVFARALWRRHRPPDAREALALSDVASRLDLLISAMFGVSLRLRVAQPPAPATLLGKLFNRHLAPAVRRAVPATDGVSIWLPRDAGPRSVPDALRYFRCMALTQAARAQRGSPAIALGIGDPLLRSVFLLLEAHAVDWELAQSLPGLAPELAAQRAEALSARPPLAQFAVQRLALERFARRLLSLRGTALIPELGGVGTPAATRAAADDLARGLAASTAALDRARAGLLYLDDWTGELRFAAPALPLVAAEREDSAAASDLARTQRSARLTRSPQVRAAGEDEDDSHPGAWMIQTSQPHEHAEDPLGLQRPTDRDEQAPADGYAESVSDLAQARLVRTAGKAKEVLLSEDGMDPLSRESTVAAGATTTALTYPEWDFRTQSYRDPGAYVRLLPSQPGPQAWVDSTLREHAALIEHIRRRFQLLRARRTRLRRQDDGDELDLDAYIEMHADLRTGRPTRQAIYQTQRAARRDAAIVILIDVSGSTDSWVSERRRVIDVEKESLILVCSALNELNDPFGLLAFSGESAHAVTLRTLKGFDEPYGMEVARRIAGLEPEAYTRTGAALRHASTLLLRQPARHRLLLLLSDGKPNDVDDYEGRYGVEDTRQAVVEARLQGIHPFCLTVDRQAASYLPRIFGAGNYVLLPRPGLLPSALLGWLKQLMER
jgi:nitric oxide reductase NorD protein